MVSVRGTTEKSLCLDFSWAFELVIANSSFLRKEVHLVTFHNSMDKIQINFLLFKKRNRGSL